MTTSLNPPDFSKYYMFQSFLKFFPCIVLLLKFFDIRLLLLKNVHSFLAHLCVCMVGSYASLSVCRDLTKIHTGPNVIWQKIIYLKEHFGLYIMSEENVELCITCKIQYDNSLLRCIFIWYDLSVCRELNEKLLKQFNNDVQRVVTELCNIHDAEWQENRH